MAHNDPRHSFADPKFSIRRGFHLLAFFLFSFSSSSSSSSTPSSSSSSSSSPSARWLPTRLKRIAPLATLTATTTTRTTGWLTFNFDLFLPLRQVVDDANEETILGRQTLLVHKEAHQLRSAFWITWKLGPVIHRRYGIRIFDMY